MMQHSPTEEQDTRSSKAELDTERGHGRTQPRKQDGGP